MTKFSRILLFICLILLSINTKSNGNSEDMRLLFVGEDQDVLSIASGREESAWQAPAVAYVVEQSEFRQNQDYTLVDVMNTIPGFHVVETEPGVHSYLRGIPNSTLYLYDTVPMDFPADMSLHSIKRIEVVRGPGSVLWGPDAFAGIVNIVPLTGRDRTGTETGVISSSDDKKIGGYINHGWNNYEWDGFLSFAFNMNEQKGFSEDITSFWGDGFSPVPVDSRRGRKAKDREHQFELAGNFSYRDYLKISGKLINHLNPYSLTDQVNQVAWKEIEEEITGFFKIEGKKRIDIDSALRFTGTFSAIDNEKQIADIFLDQEKYETYGEITYEKVFNSGSSHFTAGVSYRHAEHNGVTIWDAYFPDFLVDENEDFLPTFTQQDYTTQLWSLFSQYRMTIGKLDLNLGIRYDEHDSFEDNLSYNLGAVWTPSEDWVIKALTGTAYRTPSPRQLFIDNKTDLEEIKNLSLELSKKIGKRAELSICGFINDIDNHIIDVPYDGISTPNSQEVKGIEVSGYIKPFSRVTLSGAFTILENQGPPESFLNLDYSILLPDGTFENVYTRYDYPFDSGPDRIGNIDLVLDLEKNTHLFVRAKYFSEYPYSGPFIQGNATADSAWIFDAGIQMQEFLSTKSNFEIKVKNITDKHYLVPGEYSLEHGTPLSVELVWRKFW